MNTLKRHPGRLLIVLALVIVALTIGGCGSSSPSTTGPAPLPSEGGDIEPNDSVVFCQIQMFGEWDGAFVRTMTVLIMESTDVAGMVNYTKDKATQQIDVIIDEDLDWLMLGQQINGHIQLRANPEGGNAYYISNIVH